MVAFEITAIAEDLRRLTNNIEVLKSVTYDALSCLKRSEDIAFDLKVILQKLNIELKSIRELYELNSNGKYQFKNTDDRNKAP